MFYLFLIITLYPFYHTAVHLFTSLGLHLLYWPNTHKDLYIVYWGFLVFQLLAFVGYSSISEFFTIQGLFTNLIVIV